jgi:hypothetical protein
LTAAFAALASVAGAQSVRVEGSPARAGDGVLFHVQVPSSWQVDEVTYDPLGWALDTFVRRMPREITGCPASTTCFTEYGYDTIDERTSPGERTVTFTASGAGRSRTFTATFRVEPPADDDHDGMPDTWEWREGIEPFGRLATSAPGDDPDGDGISNIDEYRAGTSPVGRYHLLFGDSSAGDRQQMVPLLEGVRLEPLYGGRVRIRIVGDGGRQMIQTMEAYPILGAAPFYLGTHVAARLLAIEIESAVPVVFERVLYSGTAGPLATTRAVSPATEWHFATGPTSEPIDTFLLAYNPSAEPVAATLTYYRAASEAPVVTERLLQPGRTTVWLNADEGQLAGRDFSVAIRAGAPILIDRGFRWQPPGRTAPQEYVGPGGALAPQWYFPYVEAFRQSDQQLVLANPGERESGVEIAVFRREGEPRVRYTAIPPHARVALGSADLGVDTLAAVRLVTTNGVPFVAEQAQRGSVSPQGRWAASSPGVNEPGQRWGLSLARASDLVVWNPSDVDAEVEVTSYYDYDYISTYKTTLHVPARRVHRVAVNTYANTGETTITGHRAIVRVVPRSDGTPGPSILVGRAASMGALGQRDVRVEPFTATRIP